MEREADDGKTVAVVVGLIEKATNSTKPDLDPRILKSIKSVVRHSDSEVRFAVENLMRLMKRDHSQVIDTKSNMSMKRVRHIVPEEAPQPIVIRVLKKWIPFSNKQEKTPDRDAIEAVADKTKTTT